MTCAWKELLSVLPVWLRKEADLQGPESVLEIRMRLHTPPELVTKEGSRWLERKILQEDLHYTINAASRYS